MAFTIDYMSDLTIGKEKLTNADFGQLLPQPPLVLLIKSLIVRMSSIST